MTTERMHDRLPWYVNGTLEGEEFRTFQEHLETCDACRQEKSVLETLRHELEKHGEDLLRDHPPPERLAALIEGSEEPLSGDEADAVRRHLAICATCAEESSWLRGEAVAEAPAGSAAIAPRSGAPGIGSVSRMPARAPGAASRMRPWLAAAAAVAAVSLIAVVLVVRTPRTTVPDLLPQYVHLEAKQRGPNGTMVPVPASKATVDVSLEPDFDTASFPLDLEIQASDGSVAFRRDGIAAKGLVEGFLLVNLPRGSLPDGDYVLRLTSKSGSEQPEEFPFHVTSAPGP